MCWSYCEIICFFICEIFFSQKELPLAIFLILRIFAIFYVCCSSSLAPDQGAVVSHLTITVVTMRFTTTNISTNTVSVTCSLTSISFCNKRVVKSVASQLILRWRVVTALEGDSEPSQQAASNLPQQSLGHRKILCPFQQRHLDRNATRWKGHCRHLR